jgi:hypothetical protein
MKLKDYKYECPGTESDVPAKELGSAPEWVMINIPVLIIVLCVISGWIGDVKYLTLGWKVGMTVTLFVVILTVIFIRRSFKK